MLVKRRNDSQARAEYREELRQLQLLQRETSNQSDADPAGSPSDEANEGPSSLPSDPILRHKLQRHRGERLG